MLALISLLTSPAFAQDDPKAVAARYAPVIYQEFSIYTQDQGDPDRAYDQLRRVDYDGDWNPLNNLDNHGNEAADNRGYVYFDVKSTETHHYVTYTFYYVARTGLFMRRTENDLMGCVVVARRDAPKGQEVEAVLMRKRSKMVAVRQDAGSPERRKYLGTDGRKRKVNDTVVPLQFDHPEIDPERTHPRLFMDTWNHEPQVLDAERQRRQHLNFPYLSGNGVAYHYHSTVEHKAPSQGDTVVRYELLPQTELEQVENTSANGARLGSDNSAWGTPGPLLPHAWPVAKGVAPGAMASDPAGTYERLFKVRQPFSRDYPAKAAKPGQALGATGALGQAQGDR
jgi:hypothetical protein